MDFVSWFFVESKTFEFSVPAGGSTLRLVERRNGISRVMMVGKYCVEWLKKAVERMVLLNEDQPFTESSRDGNKAFFAQRGVNRAGGFLELAEYAVGGRKGLIIVPEGRDKRGWKRFARNWVRCRPLLILFSGKPESGGSQPSLFPLMGKKTTGGAAPSYAAVVSSGVPSSVLKRPVAVVANGLLGFVGSTAELDLCPLGMPEISPVLRSAVDCYDLECGVEPMGKNLCDRRFCGSQCSTDRAAEDDVVHAGGGFHRKHLECLNRFKFEIDRAFGRVKKGWQVLGLGLKPISGPSGSAPKPFKTRKFLMPRKLLLKPKPLSKPADFLGCGSKPGRVAPFPTRALLRRCLRRRWFWFRRRLGFFRCAQMMTVVLHPSRRVFLKLRLHR
ncbi:hypothetical protein SLA2020_273190 [Shorea laevis]